MLLFKLQYSYENESTCLLDQETTPRLGLRPHPRIFAQPHLSAQLQYTLNLYETCHLLTLNSR